MTDRYEAKFYVWPYAQVPREPAPYTKEMEPMRGAKNPVLELKAKNFDDAVNEARLILRGINLDERVWQAGIEEIRKVKS